MSCTALHSHFLSGLLTVYFAIVVFLLSTDFYDFRPKHPRAVNYGATASDFDLEGFKVMTSIIVHFLCAMLLVLSLLAANIRRCYKVLPPLVIVVVLYFNLMFNLAGGLCLWMHKAPNFPGGHSNAIRSTAIISTFAALCTVLLIAFYCLNVMQNPTWVEPSTHEPLIMAKSRETSKPITKSSTPENFEKKERKNGKQPIHMDPTQPPTPQARPVKLIASPNYLPLVPAPKLEATPPVVEDELKGSKEKESDENVGKLKEKRERDHTQSTQEFTQITPNKVTPSKEKLGSLELWH